MIFPVDEKALRTDLQAFLSLTEKRQARFDAAPDTPPPGDFYVNAQQRRLHPDVQTLRFRGSTVSPNGFLFCELQAKNGAVAPFRPGQQARVYCGAVSYPVFFASAPADAAKGRYVLGVSAEAQPEAFSFFERLAAGAAVSLRAPVGSFYYLSVRDRQRIVFITDTAGMPAAAAFAAAYPAGGGPDIGFYCVNCRPEPFFDGRFCTVGAVSDIPLPEKDTNVFVCGSPALCGETKRLPAFSRARCETVQEPRRAAPLNKTFSCTLVTAGGTRVFPCDSDIPLLAALETAGVQIPANCTGGECGFCRLRLLSGSVTPFDPPETDPRRRADAARAVIHACRTFPDSDLTLAF